VGLGALAIVVLVLVNIPHLTSFTVKGDDYALVQHSARFFTPSLTDWIGHGYRWYNINFPELGNSYTNFIRPTLNAVVYLTSWLSPSPTSVALLLPNYIGHGICVALVFQVGRSVFGLSRRASALAAALFLGSVTIGTDPQLVAYGGDMIAAMFALIALLALHSHLTRRSSLWKVAVVGLSLLLALFAKESAAGTPVILAIDIAWVRSSREATERDDGRRSVRTGLGSMVLAIVVPTALYAVARLAAGLNGLYVVEDLPTKILGIPMLALNPFRFVGTAFFPVETSILKDMIAGTSWDLSSVMGLGRAVVAVTLNAFGWFLIVRLLRRPSERTEIAALLGMGLAASAVPLVFKAEPRIMYFGQALLLPLFVLVLLRWWAQPRSEARRSPPWLAPAAVASLLVVGPVYYLAQQAIAQPDLVSVNRTTARTQDAILATMRDPGVHRVYLVNATSSMSPGLSALRFLAAVSGRSDLRLRVVNTFTGDVPSEGGQGGVDFARQDDTLLGVISVGPSQYLFRDISPKETRMLGQTGMIEYGPIVGFRVSSLGKWEYVGRRFTFQIPYASRDDFAIVGLDPARSGVFVLAPPSMTWMRV
jgi:hypothetical protein